MIQLLLLIALLNIIEAEIYITDFEVPITAMVEVRGFN